MGRVADDDVQTRGSGLPDAVLRYADHDAGVVDVHLPAEPRSSGRALPLVVNVHGGFWRQAWDRTHARPYAEALTGAGFVVANVEYRRGPGAWQWTFEDLDTVVSGLPRMLRGIGIATTTLTLTGHSAGGHLVLWLANQPHPVDRVVALAPVGDLRFAADTGMGNGAAVEFLGGTPEQLPEVYDAADPGSRMRTRPAAPVVVVHGDADEDVPVASSRLLAGRFSWLDVRELAGADHSALIDPDSRWWPSVLAAVRG